MLDYKLLERKQVIHKGTDQYIDLLSKTFDESVYSNAIPLIVNKYYVARPDLISLALYGDDKYADIICKINGISNPFEINEDDVIIAPNIEYFNECLYKGKEDPGLIEDPKKETIQKIDAPAKIKPDMTVIPEYLAKDNLLNLVNICIEYKAVEETTNIPHVC